MIEENNTQDDALQGGVARSQVTVEVSRLGEVSSSKEEAELIEVAPFVTNPAYVSFAVGLTKGTGVKYEFIRLDVRLSMPCYKEEVDQVYLQTKNWVDDRLTKEIEEFESQKGPKTL